MATGDEAAAAGLTVVPSTRDVRLGYEGINRRGDELARHMVSGTHPADKITGQITTGQIVDGAVVASKIANLTIGDQHMVSGTVGDRALRDGAVTASKIPNGTIGAGHIPDGALPVTKLQNRFRAGRTTVTAGRPGLWLSTPVVHGLPGSPALLGTAAVNGTNGYSVSVTRTGEGTAEIWVTDLGGVGGQSVVVSWLAVEV